MYSNMSEKSELWNEPDAFLHLPMTIVSMAFIKPYFWQYIKLNFMQYYSHIP